jgi:hypothetical protein
MEQPAEDLKREYFLRPINWTLRGIEPSYRTPARHPNERVHLFDGGHGISVGASQSYNPYWLAALKEPV